MWWRMERFDQELSIHDLTKRSTSGPSFRLLLDHLSIHDLTKRSTLERLAGNQSKGLSIHDLTKRSTLAFPCPWRCGRPFNSRPHEEVDYDALNLFFDLLSFNSRPHEEVDDDRPQAEDADRSFNSRPHEEVDPSREICWSVHGVFQFTTSRRGRHSACPPCAKKPSLSIHDLTKRSTPTTSGILIN